MRLVGSILTLTLALLAEREARACGGCFHEPPPPQQTASDITDERMLLSVSTTQTTLYDQIRYSGNPGSFAWVLPIHGTVDVGLSADIVFAALDQLTETKITGPTQNCPPPPSCPQYYSSSSSSGSSSGGSSSGGYTEPPVTVTKQQNVGPYATVQLHPTSADDPTAVTQWLTDNGFVIGDEAKTVIAQYTKEGSDFLAMKLRPDQGVQAMRPVRVTSPGASLSLPLRMAAIGTGASVGITLWVVADGRYEPQNFPAYQIEEKDLVWDFNVQSSNYTTLRAQNEANLKGKGWEIESSIDLNQQFVTGTIRSGGVVSTGGSGQVSNPADDYLPVDVDGGPSKSAFEVREDDIAALIGGIAGPNVRITRMRTDIVHAEMSTDLVLRASPDQSELSNFRYVSKAVNDVCPTYGPLTCPSEGPSQSSSSSGASGDGASSDGASSDGASGCEAIPQPIGSGDLAVAGAFVIGAVVRRMRQQRRARK